MTKKSTRSVLSGLSHFIYNRFPTKKALLDAILSLKTVGGVSNIGDALTLARKDIFEKSKCTGDRNLISNILVLITDGNRPGHDEKYHIINHEIYNLR